MPFLPAVTISIVLVFVIATLALVLAPAEHKATVLENLVQLLSYAGIAGGYGGFLLLTKGLPRLTARTLTLGDDGVLMTKRRKQRFVPWTEIANVATTARHLVLHLISNERFVVAGADEDARAKIALALTQASERPTASRAVATLVAEHDRDNDALHEITHALRADYRGARLSRDHAIDELADPTSTGRTRLLIADALLRTMDESPHPASERRLLSELVERVAEPRLRERLTAVIQRSAAPTARVRVAPSGRQEGVSTAEEEPTADREIEANEPT